MDKFAALQTFVTVVEEEGFAAAARAMGMSRSGINRLVLALEDELGAQLLNRTTRHVSPTATGTAFYQRAKTILGFLEEAEQEVRADHTDASGTLRISAPLSFGMQHLSKAVAEFMSRHPELEIDLDLSDRFVDLAEEGYDLVVRIGQPQEDAHLVDFRICEAKRVLCASPAFLAKHGQPQQPDDLKRLPCLDYGLRPATRPWRLTGPDNREVQVRPKVIFASNNGEALRDAALHDLGITLLPTFIVGEELQAGRLVTVMHDWKPIQLMLSVVYLPNRHLSAKIRLFTDFMITRFGPHPHWDLVE